MWVWSSSSWRFTKVNWVPSTSVTCSRFTKLPMSLTERAVPNRAAQSTRVSRSIFATRRTSRKSTVSFQVR